MTSLLAGLGRHRRSVAGAVLHLGAGSCHELADYLALGARRIVLVEANPEVAARLQLKTRAMPQVAVVAAAAAASASSAVPFRVLNNARDSSLLEPAGLVARYPNLRVEKRIEVPAVALDHLVERIAPEPLREDMLVAELQGADLSVLGAAAVETLQHFSWIRVRACAEPLYEGGATVEEIDALLARAGFSIVAADGPVSVPPFRARLYRFDAARAQAPTLQSRLRDESQRANSLARDKAELQARLAKATEAAEAGRVDLERRMAQLDGELSRLEAPMALLRREMPDGAASCFQEPSLADAAAQWLTGEWESLAATGDAALRGHARRGALAALVASAHQQLGAHDEARRLAGLAREWGCPAGAMAHLLLSDVHNALGRAAALLGNDARAARHFREAVAVIGRPEALERLGRARAVREAARAGQLARAAALVEAELARAGTALEGSEQALAQLRVLETELKTIQYELSLAQQRNQLNGTAPDDRPRDGARPPAGAELHERLKRLSPAQQGQDLWVLEQTGYKRGGFFVEFGAADGVILSNTWLLEKEFGWRGLCAEPNPGFLERLRRNRTCTVSDACIAGESGKKVEFILAGEFGGIADNADADMHADKRAAYENAGRTATLTTISLHDFLIRHDAPREIDYLSIDTEGNELEILAAFPFPEWTIRLLTVEHNFTAQRGPIRELLARHGYQRIDRGWEDWYVLMEGAARDRLSGAARRGGAGNGGNA